MLTKRNATYLVSASALLVAAVLFLVLAWAPGWQWSAALSTYMGVAHALAFPVALGCGLVLLGGAYVWLGVVALRPSFTQVSQPVGSTALAAGVVSVLAGALFLVPVPLSSSGNLAAAQLSVSHPATAVPVTVLSWNTQGRDAAAELAELVAAHRPEVIALPETEVFPGGRSGGGTDIARLVATDLAEDYTAFQSTNGRSTPTSVLVHKSLGRYREVAGPVTAIGSVTLAPVGDATRPTIVALHPVPPLPKLMAEWRADVSRVVRWGEAHSGPVVMAGDFNATRHHGAMTQLASLQDARAVALATTGPGLRGLPIGTWPQNLPALFGTPIDHVLVKAGSGPVVVERFDVVEQPQSDHRAVVAQVVFR